VASCRPGTGCTTHGKPLADAAHCTRASPLQTWSVCGQLDPQSETRRISVRRRRLRLRPHEREASNSLTTRTAWCRDKRRARMFDRLPRRVRAGCVRGFGRRDDRSGSRTCGERRGKDRRHAGAYARGLEPARDLAAIQWRPELRVAEDEIVCVAEGLCARASARAQRVAVRPSGPSGACRGPTCPLLSTRRGRRRCARGSAEI